jgi:Protein of unknown function (DUF5818)
VNKLLHSISFSASLAVLCAAVCWGTVAHAQQNTPDAQSPTQPQQSPAQTQQTPDTQAPPAASQTPGQTQPGQTQADAPDPNGGQTFTGTVAQQGGKYVLQSENGTVYDIDHQDQVKKFEGKRVRVHGTLDASGKMIHIQ